jgi:hypothetical protein
MRVGSLEGELEEPLFCKRSLYLISREQVRIDRKNRGEGGEN